MSVEIILAISVVILLAYWVVGRESDVELTIRRGKILEGRLKREYNAKGEGLGQLTESVKAKLPPDVYPLLSKIIVPMRNDIVHNEYSNKLINRREFVNSCNNVESQLNERNPPQPLRSNSLGFLVVFFIITISGMIYLLSQNLL